MISPLSSLGKILAGAALALVPALVLAQGVPTFDGKMFGLVQLLFGEEQAQTAEEVTESTKRESITTLRADQLTALNDTLRTLSGASAATGSLEALSGAAPTDVYAIQDNNPYAGRLFGDAREIHSFPTRRSSDHRKSVV